MEFVSIVFGVVSLEDEIEKWFWTAAIIWDFFWGSWLLLENFNRPGDRGSLSFDDSFIFKSFAWLDASSNLSSRFSASLASSTET